MSGSITEMRVRRWPAAAPTPRGPAAQQPAGRPAAAAAPCGSGSNPPAAPLPQFLETLQFLASAAFLTAGVAPEAGLFSSSLQWTIFEGPIQVDGISNVGASLLRAGCAGRLLRRRAASRLLLQLAASPGTAARPRSQQPRANSPPRSLPPASCPPAGQQLLARDDPSGQ